MIITFKAVTAFTGDQSEVLIGKEEYCGVYVVHELSAQEGIDALNELIAENEHLQENPDQLTPQQYKIKIVEKATTLNGEPLKVQSLTEMPHKIWSLLIAANEKLNSISDEEARFLLKPSSSKNPQSTPQ